MNDLSRLVANFLRQNKINQVEIAKDLGITRQAVSDKLLNKQNFNIDDANSILAVVHCHIEYRIVPNKEKERF